MKPSDNELEFSPNGAIRICHRFHKKQGQHNKNKAKIIAQKLTDLYAPLKNRQPYQQHLPQMCKSISKIYLLQKITSDLLETHSHQMRFTIGDRKIIKAISTATQIVELHKIFQETAWRDNQMETFLNEVKRILQIKIHQMKILEISQHDYEHVYCLKNMFSKQPNRKMYHILIDKTSSMNVSHYDASQLPNSQILKLYNEISNEIYQNMGQCDEKLCKRIKLKLLYLRCYFKNYCQQISVPQEDISFVHLGTNPQGFHIWQLYFDEDSTCKMDKDREFLKKNPIQPIQQRANQSQNSNYP